MLANWGQTVENKNSQISLLDHGRYNALQPSSLVPQFKICSKGQYPRTDLDVWSLRQKYPLSALRESD